MVSDIEQQDQEEQKKLLEIRANYSATPQPITHFKRGKKHFSFFKKPPKQHMLSQDNLKQRISDKNTKQSSQAVKSILKHKHSDEKKQISTTKQRNDRKHRFSYAAATNTVQQNAPLSDQKNKPVVNKVFGSRSGSKSIRFQKDIEKNNSECDDLERQFEDGINSMKVKFIGEENMKGSFGSQTQDELCLRIIKGLESTGGEVNDMDPLALQNQCIKLKTDNEILNITLRHLQEELNTKSETIRRQQSELGSLRQTILDLQSENYNLKQRKQNQKESEHRASLEKENTRGEPPKPIEKPLSPKQNNPLIYTSFGTDQTNQYSTQQTQQQPAPNIFKREPSQNSAQKQKQTRTSNYQFSPTRHKQSIESINSQTQQLSSSKRARVNKILGQANQKINEEFSSIKSSLVGGGLIQEELPKKESVLESEVQMQQFNEEFNKIFNIS